jgi:glycosyltransferase involved in cell wall biosynthesis
VTGQTRRRVCFVLPSLAGGGAERVAVLLLNALDGTRWDRSMYLFEREGPYLRDVVPEIVVTGGRARGRAGRWLELRRYFRETRPEIVVTFLSYISVLTALRAANIGARIVFNQGTPISAFLTDRDYAWGRGWRRALFHRATRAGYAAADMVTATSRGVADDMTAAFGVPQAQVRVVPNPVPMGALSDAAREALPEEHVRLWRRPVLVAAGRLADVKNYALMIEAVRRLRERIAATLFILGQGDQEPALRAQIAAAGLQDAVILCGFQQNPWKYIARADAFVLTSRYEGFGNVLIEAMACGVPVVATASAGTSDIVVDGVNGVLVPEHTPDAVAAALHVVVSDGDRRARMAAEAHQASQRYAAERVAAEYEQVLCEVLA